MGELTSTIIHGKGTDSNIRSLQNFAAKIIRDGKARGAKFNFGNINRVVEREMKKHGLSLKTKSVMMRDDTILKYENHPKAAKGAVLPANKYYMLDKLTRKPTHVYVDTTATKPIFIYTTRFSSGKVLKAVIETNYKANKMTYNSLKSIGIIDKTKMDRKKNVTRNGKKVKVPVYKKIK